MSEIRDFDFALLDLQEVIPRLFLSPHCTFTLQTLGDTQWPLKQCRLKIETDVATITGYIPQYRRVLRSVEISEEEAGKFFPGAVKERRRLFSRKRYKYLDEGWYMLKALKRADIEIRGQLVIIR